jgi:C4-dicarboxylate transporter DctM subunit
MITVLFVSFFALLILNIPVAFSLAGASLIALAYEGLPLSLVAQRMVASADSFVLLSVPFFVLAGALMERGGIAARVVDFADSVVGFIRGGLAQVAVLTSMFFAGISGAAVADASAVGSVLIPSMIQKGYRPDRVTALIAAAGTIGVIIPPSIPMIIYGIVTGVSIGQLFIAGIIPGILIGIVFMVLNILMPASFPTLGERRFSIREVGRSLSKSAVALITPIIIVGGIVGGVFTPTESAVAATVYALLAATLILRTIRFGELPKIFYEAAITTAVVMAMITAATLYGWIITRSGLPNEVAGFVKEFTSNRTVVLLLIVVIYLIIGMFIDLGAAIVILVPVLYPITRQFGIDPVHFGLITVVGLAIGLVTPPVGATLFVACGISRVSLLAASWASVPYLLGMLAVLLLMVFVPETVLYLPRLFR